MAPWQYLVRAALIFEDRMIEMLLQSPTFHRGVQRIHRAVEETRHGRNPHDPIRPNEATEHPGKDKGSFFKHFVEELGNQARGKPTDPDTPVKNSSKNQ